MITAQPNNRDNQVPYPAWGQALFQAIDQGFESPTPNPAVAAALEKTKLLAVDELEDDKVNHHFDQVVEHLNRVADSKAKIYEKAAEQLWEGSKKLLEAQQVALLKQLKFFEISKNCVTENSTLVELVKRKGLEAGKLFKFKSSDTQKQRTAEAESLKKLNSAQQDYQQAKTELLVNVYEYLQAKQIMAEQARSEGKSLQTWYPAYRPLNDFPEWTERLKATELTEEQLIKEAEALCGANNTATPYVKKLTEAKASLLKDVQQTTTCRTIVAVVRQLQQQYFDLLHNRFLDEVAGWAKQDGQALYDSQYCERTLLPCYLNFSKTTFRKSVAHAGKNILGILLLEINKAQKARELYIEESSESKNYYLREKILFAAYWDLLEGIIKPKKVVDAEIIDSIVSVLQLPYPAGYLRYFLSLKDIWTKEAIGELKVLVPTRPPSPPSSDQGDYSSSSDEEFDSAEFYQHAKKLFESIDSNDMAQYRPLRDLYLDRKSLANKTLLLEFFYAWINTKGQLDQAITRMHLKQHKFDGDKSISVPASPDLGRKNTLKFSFAK